MSIVCSCCGGSSGFGCCWLLRESAAKPRHSLHVWNNPRAEHKDEDNEDNPVVPVASDGSHETHAHHVVEREHGEVTDEIDHGVLSDVVEDRDAGHVD